MKESFPGKRHVLLGCVIVALVAILPVGVFCLLELPDMRRFERYCAYPTQGALLAAEPDAVKKVWKVELNGTTYTIFNMGFVGFLPSGPACLVYDASGRLVDWTMDEGENSCFQRKWSCLPKIPVE